MEDQFLRDLSQSLMWASRSAPVPLGEIETSKTAECSSDSKETQAPREVAFLLCLDQMRNDRPRNLIGLLHINAPQFESFRVAFHSRLNHFHASIPTIRHTHAVR